MRVSNALFLALFILPLLLCGCSFLADVDIAEIEALQCSSDDDCAQGWRCTSTGFCQPSEDISVDQSDVGDQTEVDDLSDLDDQDDVVDLGDESEDQEETDAIDRVDDCESCGTESCVDTNSSAEHCGACNAPCPTGASCEEGVCACDNTNHEICAGLCVDHGSDPLHCGLCDHACEMGEGCTDGLCDCPFGYTRCGEVCVDVLIETENCGGCGVLCPSNARCLQGECRCQNVTGDLCPSLPNVNSTCSQKTCSQSCVSGFEDCNSSMEDGCEANLSEDQNCGGCGNVCGSGCCGTTCC